MKKNETTAISIKTGMRFKVGDAMKWAVSILLFVCVQLSTYAGAPENEHADIKVSGKVTAASGEGIAGVSVSVKGSRLGTSTDGSGNYSITVPNDATLVFSSVGFESTEVAVAGKSTIDVTLQPSVQKIDEVVVIGYGTANKRDLTGSIVKISGK